MFRHKTEILLTVSIPIIFTAGIVSFFVLLPQEVVTLANFISYTSSLSTILMVLVVIFTTRQQLKQMESTKILQTQPFPLLAPLNESHVEPLKFFHGGPMRNIILGCRPYFYYKIENIGNGPAAAVDIIPTVRYSDEEGKNVTEEFLWETIGAMKQNEEMSGHILFPMHHDKPTGIECILRDFLSRKLPCEEPPARPEIDLTILYRNILGACFRQKLQYEILFSDGDEERIKSCLKLFETTRIDTSEDMEKHDQLVSSGRFEEATKLREELNKTLSKEEGCCKIPFRAYLKTDTFSIEHIPESEYQKEIKARRYGHVVGFSHD